LGNVLLDQDRVEDARSAYESAIRIDPGYIEARWALVAAQLPAVYTAADDPLLCRGAFAARLDEFERWLDSTTTPASCDAIRIQTPFYLAYQETDNRELIGRHGALCSRQMRKALDDSAPAVTAQDVRERRIRIAIVAHHLRNHSVWHAILKGWFAELDQERFELHAFHLDDDEDDETRFAKTRAASFEQGRRPLREWIASIRAREPDVVIYPEIGMEALAGQLACLRLAPVQVATWGHPETTGMPTIDYYLSAELLEPGNAGQQYTERLVTLPNLGCYCEPYRFTPRRPDLLALGIEPDVPLLVCPGVPYKYAPEHDWIFPEIAGRLERCRIVFFTYPSSPHMSLKLRARLESAFARRGMQARDFVEFLPWQEGADFFAILSSADVFLDTIGFSGFNTALKALECGLPVVTREGRFLRGRLASGLLKRIGVPELVAQSDAEYASLAVSLASDRELRMQIRNRITAGRELLFKDRTAIRRLEDFLVESTSTAATAPVGAGVAGSL
jgi:predicted O-linked N-acetylglucosamine transferase (SPINDLY family)